MKRLGESGQYLIEYAVLVAAVSFAVVFAAKFAYRAYTGHAQTIERAGVIF